MLVVPVIEGLEHALKVATLLDYNGFQLIIISNSYVKVVANRAKICYLKFATELLFKGVNGGSAADNLNIVYVN